MNLAPSTAPSDPASPDSSRRPSQMNRKPDRDDLLQELFEKSGGFSRFQFFAWLVIQLSVSCGGFWWYGLGFMLQEPTFTCTFTQHVSKPDDVCTAKNICDNDPRIDEH